MKKFTFAVMAVMISGSTFAADNNAYTINEGGGAMTTPVNAASNYTYTVATERANRLFVKNNFDFTLSANTIIQSKEDAESRYMGVATANVRGRNIFTGHSDGGSVTSCGDPLTAAEAKRSGAHAKVLGERFDAAEVTKGACTEKQKEG